MSKEFGNRLTELLSVKDIKQSDLACMIGKSSSAVSAYCRGTAEPSLEVLVKIAIALNVTCDSLLNVPLHVTTRGENFKTKFWLFYAYDALTKDNKKKVVDYTFNLYLKDTKVIKK